MTHNKILTDELSGHVIEILEQSHNGITITNPNTQDNPIIYANNAFCKMFEYELDEILNKNCRFLHGKDSNQIGLKKIKESVKNKEPIITSIRNYKKDGSLVIVELSISPIFDDKKNLKFFLGIQKDVTNERKLFEQIKISQNLANIGSWELDLLTNELYWSDEIYNLFEIDQKKFKPSYEAFLNVIHPDDRELVNNAYIKSLESKQKYTIQHRLLMNDGRIKYVEEKCISFFNQNSEAIKSVGTVQDITAIKEIEIELQKTLSFFQSHKLAMDESSIVSKCDEKGIITYVNDNFCKIAGFTKEEVIGKPHSIVRHPDNPDELFKDLWSTVKSKKVWKKILKNRDKFGKDYWVDTSILPILDENNNIVEYIAVRHDVTKMIQQQIELDNIANTDVLTGLGNRYKLLNDIKSSFSPALAIINIDNFNEINNFYGHETGDFIIKEFAKKIIHSINQNHLNIYHFQGDEYVVLSRNIKKDEFTEIIINLSKKLENEKIYLDDEYLSFNFTIAISFENKNEILKTANMALKFAKENKKEFVIYRDEISLNGEYENNIKWTKKIKNSLENDQFIPVFQPIVNNKTLKWEKYESLVRLQDEDNKLISPYFFLDISKKTKHYASITKVMIEKTFKFFTNIDDCEFSINLTIDDILNTEIKEFILNMLKVYNIGSKVVFEIVESESIENFEEVSSFIEKVKLFGCKIAIDDFGTGYSNFQYLVKLNADYIKIDGSLIKDIDTNKSSEIVCRNIVNFAKDLKMKTIAEFVENESIFNKVKELGIDYSQGYYFSKPRLDLDKLL